MNAFVATVLSVLFGLGLSGGSLADALRRALRDDIPSAGRILVDVDPGAEPRLGSVRRIQVTIDRMDAREMPLAALVPVPAPRTPKGRIERLELVATDVWLDSFRASEVVYHADDLRYSLRAAVAGGGLRVNSVGSERLSVLFRDGDLDEYARTAYPALLEPRVVFEGRELVFRADIPAFLAAFHAEVRGRLAIEEGRKLVLREATVDTGRMELSDEARAEVLRQFDPLLDLDRVLEFPVPLRWDTIDVTNGQALLIGGTETVDLPRPEPTFRPRERYTAW